MEKKESVIINIPSVIAQYDKLKKITTSYQAVVAELLLKVLPKNS